MSDASNDFPLAPLAPNPVVSVVIPCRNEAAHIEACLNSISHSSFPKDRLEVVVADGMSTDGTREVVDSCSRRMPFVRLVDNPERTTPYAFNAGIIASKGNLIFIMSAHAELDKWAIARAVELSRNMGAHNVGGAWHVKGRTTGIIAEALLAVMSHRFGVGNATYRTGAKEAGWVDTAAYGCYRREVFEHIGLFNVALTRGQDMELNLRLAKAGGRTYFDPEIIIHYAARSRLFEFFHHQFRNGEWAILPFAYSDIVPVSPRHLVPLAFVLSLILGGAGFRPLFWLIAASYGVCAVAAAWSIAWRSKHPALFFLTPLIFLGLHLSYGLGSFVALPRIIGSFGRRSRSDIPKLRPQPDREGVQAPSPG